MSLELAQQRIEVKQAALAYRSAHRREFSLIWYDWQKTQAAHGKKFLERVTLTANQVGKSVFSTYEMALHLTGDYAAYGKTQGEQWPGMVIEHPGNYFGMGVDNRQLRRVIQNLLFGKIEGDRFTGGWVHRDEIDSFTRSHAETGLASSVNVKHLSGGKSTISLFAHTQSKTGHGSLNIAGETVDGILADEQPEDHIIGQLAARRVNGRNGKGGFMLTVCTPERGMTDALYQVMNDPAPGQVLIGPISWDECPHITPEIRETLLASIPAHEREMRTKGIPLFGTGRVFRIDEEEFLIDPFAIPAWFFHLRAMDIGIGHPAAVSWLCYNPENDITYLVKTYRRADANAATNAAAANALWKNVPMVFPHDINNRNPGSGKDIRRYFADAGIEDGIDFANPEGGKSVEPGIFAMQNAIESGKFYAFRGTCHHFVEEARMYHRKDGKLVDKRDDVIASTRYGFQMIKTKGITLIKQKDVRASRDSDNSFRNPDKFTRSDDGRLTFNLAEVMEHRP